MTRTEAKTLIRNWLKDPNGGYFTDTILELWINLAQREVQKVLLMAGENYYQKVVETSTVQYQADYVLPSDFMIEHRLEFVVSGTGLSESRSGLTPITTNDQDNYEISAGQSVAYAIKKDRVTLFPTPDNVYTLRLYYSPMIADIASDGTAIDIPEQYVSMVPIFAAEHGFVTDDRMPQNLLTMKNDFLTRMKQASEGRRQDRSRQVNQSIDYESVNSW